MSTTEDKFADNRTDIDLLIADYKAQSSAAKKIDAFNRLDILIKRQKQLIEDLKIEVINMDKNPSKATREQLSNAKMYIELAQMPNFSFDQLKQIITALREINNAIPTTAEVFDNIENEIAYDINDAEAELEID